MKSSKIKVNDKLIAPICRPPCDKTVEADLEHAKQALKVSEEKYQSVFENTGTATIIIENDMSISMVNNKFEKLTGFRKKEIEGKMSWEQFVHPKDLERMRAYHAGRRQNADNVPNEYECTVIDRNGTVKNILLTIDMITETSKSVASFMDISSLKLAERELAESERKLSTLMANLPGMAYRRRNDEQWSLEFVSEGCEELSGYSPEDMLEEHSSFVSLIHPEDLASIREQIKSALTRRLPYEFMYRIITADKESKWVWEQGRGFFSDRHILLAMEGFITDITSRKQEELALQKENLRLRSSMKERFRFGKIIGRSSVMQSVYHTILKSAESSANVIIYGESGTGKDLVAREIHDLSDRSHKNFVPVNCGAIPETLLESELFGYVRGAFTGAGRDKAGFLDSAQGGTLFLDEIGEIGLSTQVKLLRAIEGGGYTPVGGTKLHKPDIRIIAATNKNLLENIRTGLMREDFFYRIHVIPVNLPPLRERREDIPLLVDYFMSKFRNKSNLPAITAKIMEKLVNYNWPGNVRELQNVLYRFLTLKRIDFIGNNHPGVISEKESSNGKSETITQTLRHAVESFEKQHIKQVLTENQWQKKRVADILGIDRKTLFRKIAKYGL